MAIDWNFLDEVWRRQCRSGDRIFLAVKNRRGNGAWRDRAYYYPMTPDQEKDFEKSYPDTRYDIYFCPLPFLNSFGRQEQGVIRTSMLWADLDKAYPPDHLQPSLLWESSPGRFQALWFLTKELKPEEAAELNKRLTYSLDADKSGWDLTQVLRVPGTRNLKYDDSPRVELRVRALSKKYSPMKLFDQLPEVKMDLKERVDVDFKNLPDVGPLLKKIRSKLPRKAYKLLTQAHTPAKGKRSEILWYLENELLAAGLTPAQIIAVVKVSVWNKHKGRHDELERLQVEMEKILGKKAAKKAKKELRGKEADEDVGEEDEEEPRRSVTLRPFQETMSSLRSDPGWLVEGWWTRSSYGIVAGEPKCFKSTLTLELAVSVASGAPFLGKFLVHEKGRVLIIQNENAAWIQKDRFTKILNARGLIGEVDKIVEDVVEVKWPPNLPITSIDQEGITLDDSRDKEIIELAIQQVKPILVIFDPLYLMIASDLNSAQEMQPVLQWLLSLNTKYGCAIMAVHHKRKNNVKGQRHGQGLLGSVTLHGWTESAWYVSAKTVDEAEEHPEVLITVNREFRGSAPVGSVDIAIRMGPMGSADYECGVEAKTPKPKQATGDRIRRELEASTPIPSAELAKRLGMEERDVRKVLKEMQLNKEVMMTQFEGRAGWTLTGEIKDDADL